MEKYACMGAKLLQLCLTLWDFMDCSPPGSSVHGILQSRILEWVAMPSSRGSSQPRGQTQVSCMCLCGEDLQCSGHAGFAPAHRCMLSPSTLLRLPAALFGACPVLCAVPVFWYSTKAWTRLHLHFGPFPPEQLRQPGA